MLRTKVRRLDFFFISNTIQEANKRTDFLAAFSTDHSPILFNLSKFNILAKVKGPWKFNNSLTSSKDCSETTHFSGFRNLR